MNQYILNDIAVGMQESFRVVITGEMMEHFCTITGDCNPLHTNETYARECGYKGTVVYGLLTGSFLSTLAGVYLPGEKSLIQSVEMKCTSPVYINDELLITGTVTEINDTFSFIVVKYRITNQDGLCIMRGKMQIGVRR